MRFSKKIILLICTLMPITLFADESDIVSRPVGFVRISVLPNEQRLVALPFKPFDPSINKVLAGQLTGSTDEETADGVIKWDSFVLKYDQAFKADGVGNSKIDGRWFSGFDPLVESPLTIEPGEGFILWNRQAVTQDVFLCGEVVLDDAKIIVFQPSLNLVGYPYSTLGSVSGLTGKSSSCLPVPFGMGEGFWFNNTSLVETGWQEARPYFDVFSAKGKKPSISGIQVKDGRSIVLTIETTGVAGEKLDVYYKDIAPDEKFESDKNWLMADVDIPVNGSKMIEWTDSGNLLRKPVNEVAVRIYLVGRADVDSDGDGVPDARERFVSNADPLIGSSGEENKLDDGINGGQKVDKDKKARDRHRNGIKGKTIHVDCNIGDDSYDGLSDKVYRKSGPKRTVNAAKQIAVDGDTILVNEGVYRESVNLCGRSILFIGKGNVIFR